MIRKSLLKNDRTPGLLRLIHWNTVQAERQIAYLRLLLIFTILVATFIVAFHNRRFSTSDLASLVFLGVATIYTLILIMALPKYRFIRPLSFVSSTVDIILVSAALYFSQYDPDSSVASIVSSGAFAVYAPVILFSIRRHDSVNTLYTGILASVGYLILILYLNARNVFEVQMISESGLIITHDLTNELIKVILLAVTGFLGYVTSNNFDRFFLKGLTEERKKEQIKSAFGRYVSGELVDCILAHQIPTSGERRVITVMFIDMKNFTALSERIPPQTLIKVLNMYFSYCIDILRKYGGFIDKFIGDALMVEFGVPVADARHRQNAVRCAVELYRCCSRLQEEVRSLGLDWRLEFGIGINTGEAIVGNLGTPERMEYTALGDTVNTASRIEGITRRFRKPIVVGADTWCDELKDLLEDGQQVSLRGKEKPVTVHVVKVDD